MRVSGPRVFAAFQGNPGSYGEVAARQAAPQVCGYPTFEAVTQAVARGEVALGVLPVENTLLGGIRPALDVLHAADLCVTGEVVVRVCHCLLALPGVQLTDIRRVASQQPALDQCTALIRRHGWHPVAMADTAGSARHLAERGARDEAAIASRRAAELYGLNVLQSGVGDTPNNFTRFVVLSRPDPGATVPRGGAP